jgi:hypothetical protein
MIRRKKLLPLMAARSKITIQGKAIKRNRCWNKEQRRNYDAREISIFVSAVRLDDWVVGAPVEGGRFNKIH